MMEYIELATMILVVALFVVLYVKQPTRMYSVVLRAVVSDIEKNQIEISERLYKRLPNSIREKITAQDLITVITYVMSVVLDVLKEHIKDDTANKK